MTSIVTAKDRSILCRLHYKRISAPANLSGLSEVFAGLESPSILGGNTAKKDSDRFSYWAAEPVEIFEFKSGESEPFEKLYNTLNKYKLMDSRFRGNDIGRDIKLPKGIFCGGWIGYFGYEFGRYIEKLPATTLDDFETPLVRLCFYDRLIVYDHIEDGFWLIALQLPDDIEGPDEKIAALEKLLARSREIHIPKPETIDLERIDFSSIRCNMCRDYYFEAIEKIKRYIYDGEVYQINFSQRFESEFNAEPIDLFYWQNHYNPSGYAAYIDAEDFHVVSASPEMFIKINDGFVQTKPIKGTRRRFDEKSPDKLQAEQINAKNYNELLNSIKEQAELNMIIDLERNDMARICRPGTRRVIQPRTIETYPTVFHAVATVGGRLRDEVTFCDILKAMFPGGSITGAPKIRAMEIIDETEPTARGVYTGSIGFIGIDGSACLNIAIRTIIIRDRTAYAQTGGGIVADSEPQAEWDETITKARALLAGINVVRRGT